MMNRTILVGRLTKDPELRYTPNGVAVATFTLAVNRPFKNAEGETEADFINVVVWRRPAENVANFLKKGSLAGVDGRIQTRNYEGQDGKKVYVTEILAESVQFLEPKSSTSGTTPGYQGDPGTSTRKSPEQRGFAPETGDPFNNNGGTVDIQDDDLPF